MKSQKMKPQKMKSILKTLLLPMVIGISYAELPKENGELGKIPAVRPAEGAGKPEQKDGQRKHSRRKSDEEPILGHMRKGSCFPVDGKGYIRYDVANTSLTTSCVGLREEDYLRFRAEGGTPTQTHAELGSELEFSWKAEEGQVGDLFLEMYAIRDGQRADRLDPQKNKPIHSIELKGNSVRLSSFAKSLPKGTYLWMCVLKAEGRTVWGSNPELLVIHHGSDFDRDKPASKHKRRATKKNWSLCPPWHK